MVRMLSILRLAVSVAVVFSIVNAPTCEAKSFEKPNVPDLTDLSDASRDETSPQRNLQQDTPAPSALGIPSANSMVPTAAPTPAGTSGALGLVQAAASLATAATVLMAATMIA